MDMLSSIAPKLGTQRTPELPQQTPENGTVFMAKMLDHFFVWTKAQKMATARMGEWFEYERWDDSTTSFGIWHTSHRLPEQQDLGCYPSKKCWALSPLVLRIKMDLEAILEGFNGIGTPMTFLQYHISISMFAILWLYTSSYISSDLT